MLKAILFLSLFAIGCSNSVIGQQIFRVNYGLKPHVEKFYLNQPILLKTDSNEVMTGRIMLMTYAFIRIDTTLVLLSEIKKVFLPEKRRGWKFFKSVGRYVGFGFLAISSINRAINNEGPVFDDRTLKVAYISIGSSLFFDLFDYKKVTLNKRNYVDVIVL